jgi:hypothetical protein
MPLVYMTATHLSAARSGLEAGMPSWKRSSSRREWLVCAVCHRRSLDCWDASAGLMRHNW